MGEIHQVYPNQQNRSQGYGYSAFCSRKNVQRPGRRLRTRQAAAILASSFGRRRWAPHLSRPRKISLARTRRDGDIIRARQLVTPEPGDGSLADVADTKGTLEGADGLTLEKAKRDIAAAAVVDEDRRLVDRAQAGDVRAFEALVRRYERWVFTLAVRMVGDRSQAEDLAQEVFLKAYRGLRGFRGGARFSTWLYAIASHHCLNYLTGRESRMRRAEQTDGPPDGHGGIPSAVWGRVADGAPGPDALLERQELRRLIQDALLHLSEDHRMAVILRDIQGMSYEEMAETLGVELGTVRSRLHRARMELKAQLGPCLGDGSRT
jgi:RNA polymerase sigma-70 factor, ECF subfamily